MLLQYKIALTTGLIILFATVGVFYYLNAFYIADKASLIEIGEYAEQYKIVISQNDSEINISPDAVSNERGIIFYQGGKVEEEAYLSMLVKLSKESESKIFIPRMPFNLAILNISVANNIIEQNKEIKHWTIVGHSLGGTAAAMYIDSLKLTKETGSIQCIKAPCPQKCSFDKSVDSLILLGSYSSNNLNKKLIDCLPETLNPLLIYGSNDKILSFENYNNSKTNLPSNFIEIVIQGMNHSQIGRYGTQSNDGVSTITNDEAENEILINISNFLADLP
jgi:predicted alpha/beta hydrolase family esterase